MASISSLGAGSGIFSADLVDKLVNAERQPTEVRLNQRQQRTQGMISAFGRIQSALEALKGPMEALKSSDGLKAFTGASSNEGVIGVAVDSGQASRGNYSVNVTQMAQAQSLATGVFADKDTTTVGTGTLTLSVGGVDTAITLDGTNNTLQGLADEINGSDAGVSAGVVDTGSGFRLVISSDETGTANEVRITAQDDDGNNTDAAGLSQFVFDGTTNNLTDTVAAKDALLEVNGIAISRSTNTIEDVVEGVTFEVAGIGSSSVKVEQDAAAVSERMQAFVDKYNELQDVIRSASGFNADSGVGGLLNGDSAVRGVQNQLRGIITSVVPGLEGAAVRTLADVGISTDPNSGKLEFDQAKFETQLADNPEDVSALFSEVDGNQGIAAQTLDVVNRMLEDSGPLSSRTEGLNADLERIQDQRDRLDLRVEAYRERLVRQFTAADQLLAQLNSTQDFVGRQLAALMPQGNSDN